MNYSPLPMIYYAAEGAAGAAAEPEVETAEPEEAEPAEKTEPEPEDDEELEVDGVAYRVPKALKPHIMMEKDYRHKTMEFGETKREFEARVATHEAQVKKDQEFVQTSRQFQKESAQMENIAGQIEHYEKKVDWARWRTESPEQAQQGYLEYQDLLRQRNMVGSALNEKLTAMQKHEQEQGAKRIETFNRELPLKIKDWSPTKQAALKDRATKTYGLTPSDFDGINDSRAMQILHDAHMYHELLSAQGKAAKAAAVEGAKPVPKVKTVARAGSGEPSDRDDDKTWLAKRNAQVAAQHKARLSDARR